MRFKRSPGIRTKLVAIFVLIKVLPLVVLAWFAWNQIASLGTTMQEKSRQLGQDTRRVVSEIGRTAVQDSIRALDDKSREAIERLTTDTARRVADFLYARDDDLRQAAALPVGEAAYRAFLAPLRRTVMLHRPWKLSPEGDRWIPATESDEPRTVVVAGNPDNSKDFHSRPPEDPGIGEDRPLYAEMTFVDLAGRERIKVRTSDLLPAGLRDVSRPEHTYCKAERYFPALQKLAPGEIYVSDVIGPYVPSPVIGPYTPARAAAAGVPFAPEEAGYAGKENPVGKRFKGIVRWAAPVVRDGRRIGWVTLALDHTHIMEFTDHILPTDERYTTISDAASGNYAFIWDRKGRNVSHARDYFIVGYDPATGEPALPWLEDKDYEAWRKSREPVSRFLAGLPWYRDQSLHRNPSPEQTSSGFVGLDCRYLNFAPQCTGWNNLTRFGGSGSFVIFWSGLWKLTTAAAIPYYTGPYGETPQGFGFVTIGANVHEFHKPATESATRLGAIVNEYGEELEEQNRDTQELLASSLARTSRDITVSTAVMVGVVILIAIWMASTLTRKITRMIRGIRIFQGGRLDHRLPVGSRDELGQLAMAFNAMSDDIGDLVTGLRRAEENYRGIVENAVEGIFQSTMAGRFITVNPAMAHILGYDSPDQMVEEIQDIATDYYADPACRARFMEELNRTGRVEHFELQARRRDGSFVWLSNSTRVVRDGKGGLKHLEGMVIDVTERKEVEQAEREREAAEARSQAKTEFLARMSHEIRTPMNAVVGVADLLEDSPLSRDQRALVRMLRTSGENLLALIDDILDISKIEADKLVLDTAPCSLSAILESVCDMLLLRARQKGIYLECTKDPDVPDLVMADAVRVRQVLVNLVGNAVKFTHQGGVRVHVRRDDGPDSALDATPAAGANGGPGGRVGVRFEIADTGIGIDPARIDELFDRFSQADTSTTRTYGGTGLGLAISRSLVELMGGSMETTSRPGAGSLFAFRLDIQPAPPGAQPVPEPAFGAAPVTPAAAVTGPPVRLLLVDDVESNRVLVGAFLRGTRFVLEAAENGEAAVALLRSGGFDGVLMDMEMPAMDGYTATRLVRGLPGPAGRVPVVALTAHAKVEDRARCLEAGCTEYLSKPVRKAELLRLLQHLFPADGARGAAAEPKA
jgi:PAS domain S-box-containing protein